MNNPILLMTACIAPKGMSQTVLQNADERKRQYIEAIHWYLRNTPFPIVFTENSGTDISSVFKEEYGGRIEFITYNEEPFDGKLGKGYGEGMIVRKALSESAFLRERNAPIIIKVTGRHIVKNIMMIYGLVKVAGYTKNYVCCDINRKTKGAISDMFIASKDFYNLLMKRTEEIDESKGCWFEHILYGAIVSYVSQRHGKFCYLPLPLRQEGVSGSMGTKLQTPNIPLYCKNFIKFIFYKIGFYSITE